MYKLVIPEEAPKYCLIMDETRKVCFNFMPISEQETAQNVVDALNAVKIFGVSISEIVNQRNDFRNALKNISEIYDWCDDTAGSIAIGTLRKHKLT